eukprot:5669410-Pyramimonas_sp.AAC.1
MENRREAPQAATTRPLPVESARQDEPTQETARGMDGVRRKKQEATLASPKGGGRPRATPGGGAGTPLISQTPSRCEKNHDGKLFVILGLWGL